MVLIRLALVLVAVLVATAGPAAGAETREVIAKPREPRPDVFFLAGRVRPAYERRPAILQRRNCGGCVWFAFDRFRTDGESRFRRPVPDLKPGQKKVCYRVKVPGSKGFEKALSETHCIGAVGTG
jgi:hypothetical protein